MRNRSLLAVAVLSTLLFACGGTAPRADGRADAQSPPPAAVAAYTEATLLSQSGQLDQAATRYDEAAHLDPTSAQTWIAAARARNALHDAEGAASRAREALKVAPDDNDVLADVAHILGAAGHADEGRTLLRERLEKSPKLVPLWLTMAELAQEAGALDEAQDALEHATREAPGNAVAFERLGRVEAMQGRAAQAAVAFDRAATLDPRRTGLLPLVLRLALEGDELDVARHALERMSNGKGGPGQASAILADMLKERGDLMNAVAELNRAVAADPQNGVARIQLAGLYIEAKRWADADAQLATVSATSENYASSLRLRAWVALSQDQLDVAYTHLEAAQKAGGDGPEVVAQQVRIRRKQNRLPEAHTLVAKGRVQWSDDADLAYLEAMLPQDEGDEPKALNLMTAVTERFPEHAGALNFVGYALAEKGERLDEAEALIRRALKHEPDDGAIIDSLGWVLFKRGALADAETELRHAVTLLPQEGELQFHLGEVLAARGDKAGAIEAMTKALLLAQTGGDASEADVRANIRKWKSRLERVRKGKLK